MKTIESKISRSYIGSVIFIHCIALTTITISATYLRDIFYVEKRIIAGVVIVCVILYLISVWKGVLSPKKIIVNPNGIKVYNANAFYEIAFYEIAKIEKEKTRIMLTQGVPFSDGFTFSRIILKQGKTLLISPDKFANYSEIMNFVTAHWENSSSI